MPIQSLGLLPGSKVIFKLYVLSSLLISGSSDSYRPFDQNRLSLSACLIPQLVDVTRLLCRWVDREGAPQYSSYGVHELCVRRRGSSLLFDRLSLQTGAPKIWLALFFKTWESKRLQLFPKEGPVNDLIEMALFHDSFVALKSRCPLTVACSPDDYILGGERKLFQEYVRASLPNRTAS